MSQPELQLTRESKNGPADSGLRDERVYARQPALFISHGGGPSFFLDHRDFPGEFGAMLKSIDKNSRLADWLRSLVQKQCPEPPRAVLVVSAHWESSGGHKVLMADGESGENGLLFDYGGFPAETYKLKWSARNDRNLASRTLDLLRAAGLPAEPQEKRKYDHGVFVPMMLAFPDPAKAIPFLAVSLDSNLSPAQHIKLGRALRPLRDEGILIIGSGFATHNLGEMRGGAETPSWFEPFTNWMRETVAGKNIDDSSREAQLVDWSSAPGASEAHPREEHLIPLHVVAAAGGEEGHNGLAPGEIIFDEDNGAASLLGFRWA